MIQQIMLSVANMFSIIGIGLLTLFLLRLFSLFNNWEKIALAIPLGLGINGWILFMLGSCGYLNKATSLIIILSGVIALLCFLVACWSVQGWRATMTTAAEDFLARYSMTPRD